MQYETEEKSKELIRVLRKAGIKICLTSSEKHQNSKLYAKEVGVFETGSDSFREMPVKEINTDTEESSVNRMLEILHTNEDNINLAINGKSVEHILNRS